MKKYAIFDQTTGQHSFYSISDPDLSKVLAQKILEIHMKINNGQFWLMIEDAQDEDGNQGHSYHEPKGDDLPDTILLEQELEKVVSQLVSSSVST